MTDSTTLAAQVKPGSTSRPKSVSEEAIYFLQPNPKFDAVLRSTKESSSRFWLFYHASYVEAFGKSAPYGQLSDKVIKRISTILGEEIPSDFKNPESRRTFFNHANKARRILGWEKFDRWKKAEMQRWLNGQAERSDSPEYLEQALRDRARLERFLLPAQSAIDRIIASARTYAQDWIAESITSGLSAAQQSLDKGDFKAARERVAEAIEIVYQNASAARLKPMVESI